MASATGEQVLQGAQLTQQARVQFGPMGAQEGEASVERGSYDREALVGRHVVVALEGDEATLVAAHSHASGRVLLAPDREVDPGTVVS